MRRAPFTVVDTGLGSAELNQVIDRAWLIGHAQGQRVNLLRFYRNAPSALLGMHQWPERELRLLYCHRKGIEVVRRITGGGTLYVDERQLGFSLILKWTDHWAELGEAVLLERGCQAVVRALRGFDIDAVYKQPNDIEVDGRKLASLFMARYRGSVLLQGVLLLSADPARMLGALRLPTEPASGQGTAAERLTGLDRLVKRVPTSARIRKSLADAFALAYNLTPQSSTKTVYATVRNVATEHPLPSALDCELRIPTTTTHWREQTNGQAALAESIWHAPTGLLRARLRWDALRQAPRWLEIGGNVQVYPLDLFVRLARGLEGVTRSALPASFAALCDQLHARCVGFGREDLLELLQRVWDRAEQQRRFGLTPEQANRLMVLGGDGAEAATALVAKADTLVLPYCARPPACRDQPISVCETCSDCEVGAACRSAVAAGMKVCEATGATQLESLLAQLRADGSQGVVGATCQTFFVKRHDLFRRAGIPLLLVDLDGTTCYELQQEAAGYAGRFSAKTTLNMPVFEKILGARSTPGAGKMALETDTRAT